MSVIAVLGGLLVMWLVMLGFFSMKRGSALKEEWAASLQQVPEQFAETAVNESALRLEALSAALGISLVPDGAARSASRSPAEHPITKRATAARATPTAVGGFTMRNIIS